VTGQWGVQSTHVVFSDGTWEAKVFFGTEELGAGDYELYAIITDEVLSEGLLEKLPAYVAKSEVKVSRVESTPLISWSYLYVGVIALIFILLPLIAYRKRQKETKAVRGNRKKALKEVKIPEPEEVREKLNSPENEIKQHVATISEPEDMEGVLKEKENLPSWDDIGGLENVKDVIKKSVVIGIIENKPKAIEAWNTILFYGPPGTGKTLMAAAVAKNIDATFFDVKVSQLLSKYYGESPKIMSALFEVAREEAPSVVFIDEFDSIALSRGADIDEESRRGLSTLLAELDGLSSKASDKKFVLVIAATNTPDAIDEAIMSRFGKKIEIPLPDYEACKEILRIHTERKGVGLEDDSLYDKLARYCVEHEMSGRDIKFMCTEAIWRMLDEMNPGLEKLAEEPYERIREYELRTRELKEGDFKGSDINE